MRVFIACDGVLLAKVASDLQIEGDERFFFLVIRWGEPAHKVRHPESEVCLLLLWQLVGYCLGRTDRGGSRRWNGALESNKSLLPDQTVGLPSHKKLVTRLKRGLV